MSEPVLVMSHDARVPAALRDCSAGYLVKLFNSLSEPQITRFADKGTAVRRLMVLLNKQNSDISLTAIQDESLDVCVHGVTIIKETIDMARKPNAVDKEREAVAKAKAEAKAAQASAKAKKAEAKAAKDAAAAEEKSKKLAEREAAKAAKAAEKAGDKGEGGRKPAYTLEGKPTMDRVIPRLGSARATAFGMLCREEGATPGEIGYATGWSGRNLYAGIRLIAHANGFPTTEGEDGRIRILDQDAPMAPEPKAASTKPTAEEKAAAKAEAKAKKGEERAAAKAEKAAAKAAAKAEGSQGGAGAEGEAPGAAEAEEAQGEAEEAQGEAEGEAQDEAETVAASA